MSERCDHGGDAGCISDKGECARPFAGCPRDALALRHCRERVLRISSRKGRGSDRGARAGCGAERPVHGRAHGRCAGAGRVAESRGSAACFTATARRHARRARRPIVRRLRRSDVGGEDRGSWQGCEGWRYRAPLKDVAHLRACVSGVSRNPRPRPRTSL